MQKLVLNLATHLKPVKTACMQFKEVWRKLDSFLFMQDGSENDIKPYFYGSTGLGLISILLTTFL